MKNYSTIIQSLTHLLQAFAISKTTPSNLIVSKDGSGGIMLFIFFLIAANV